MGQVRLPQVGLLRWTLIAAHILFQRISQLPTFGVTPPGKIRRQVIRTSAAIPYALELKRDSSERRVFHSPLSLMFYRL